MNALAGTILGAVVGGGCSILAVRMTLYVERKQRHISDRREKQALTGGWQMKLTVCSVCINNWFMNHWKQ
ncbi:hypothetical protein AAN93_005214 [Salmonella enterica subsp. enterica]|uniref:Uncharacterized protein n=1 Tax=Salmonella enterica TaxID=28901 RepID=A0A7D8IQK0_SALER|nr:hypothetical protein [Salmonella enterica subsp. enterica serovar Amherstiana]SUF97857.1 Uncharacterised protein [Salmonella enterica]